MYSSSYYSSLISEERAKLEKYKKQRKELDKIEDWIHNKNNYELISVNNKITEVKSEGTSAIRHDLAVTNNIENIEDAKEKNYERDNKLSGSSSALSSEINDLDNKIRNCENRINELERLRQAALEEERRRAEEEARRREEASAKASSSYNSRYY